MNFLYIALFFSIGFVIGFTVFLYHSRQNDVQNLLNLIKEDIASLTVHLLAKK